MSDHPLSGDTVPYVPLVAVPTPAFAVATAEGPGAIAEASARIGGAHATEVGGLVTAIAYGEGARATTSRTNPASRSVARPSSVVINSGMLLLSIIPNNIP